MNKKYPLALAFFLILLRLAIGWHFYVEGAKKVKSLQDREECDQQALYQRDYLRGSTGPLADLFRKQAGDPDAEALARLDVSEKPLPPALDKRLRTITSNRFVEHLKIDEDKVSVRHRLPVPFLGGVWVPDPKEADKPQLDLAKARA